MVIKRQSSAAAKPNPNQRKQNLCLDKGYRFSRNRKRSYQKKIHSTYRHRGEGKRIIKKDYVSKEMGCYRKNKFVAQQIQKVISKV